MEDASWEKAKRCRAACGTRAILYTSSAGGRNVNGLDACDACKIRCNKLSNRSKLAFKCLLTALQSNEILCQCWSSDVRCGAGALGASPSSRLASPPTFRSQSLLSVMLPHCPRHRARRVLSRVSFLAFMSALGTAASHLIRTTAVRRSGRHLATHVSVKVTFTPEDNRCCHEQQQLTA